MKNVMHQQQASRLLFPRELFMHRSHTSMGCLPLAVLLKPQPWTRPAACLSGCNLGLLASAEEPSLSAFATPGSHG